MNDGRVGVLHGIAEGCIAGIDTISGGLDRIESWDRGAGKWDFMRRDQQRR